MSASFNVRSPRVRVPHEPPSPSTPDLSRAESLATPVGHAIWRTRQWLLAQQNNDGSWCAELEGDTILESETILVLGLPQHGRILRWHAGRPPTWCPSSCPKAVGPSSPVGSLDISGSVKAYFALKLTGHDPGGRIHGACPAGNPPPISALTRSTVLRDSIWPSWDRFRTEHCPAVPPEMVLLPKMVPGEPVCDYAWSRTIVVPLSIVAALEPVRRIEQDRGIHELFLQNPNPGRHSAAPRACPGGTGWLSWDHFFRVINGLLKFGQRGD